MSLYILCMLQVAIIQVGGASWANGVGDEEVSCVSMEEEQDVVVVEEVG